jgi:predicted RNA binding protein with dsRBD fold (UPF0201 family)
MFFASIWENLALSEAVWGIVGTGLVWCLGLFYSWLRKQGIENEAIDALRDGIAQTGDEFVAFRKRAAADGKLTEEEREEAKQLAISNALAMAKGPAYKLLVSWGMPKLQGLVARIVQGDKK